MFSLRRQVSMKFMLAGQHLQVFGGANRQVCIDHTLLPRTGCTSYSRSPNPRPIPPLLSFQALLHSGCGLASGEYAWKCMFSELVLIVSVQDNLKELAEA